MNTRQKNLLCLLALIVGFSLLAISRMNAQTFTTIYNFSPAGEYGDNQDGGYPCEPFLLLGETLYGTAGSGGAFGGGTVFALNTDGSGFTNLHSFDNTVEGQPASALIISGSTIYGNDLGGLNDQQFSGSVFAINTNGTGFTNLFAFSDETGGSPRGTLVLSGSILYGASAGSGDNGVGSVFAVNTNGTCFTNVYSFTGGSDGRYPFGGVVLSGNTLYGTTREGGIDDIGTIFKVNTDGTGFTTIHFFAPYGNNFTNSDGANPTAELVLSGNTLFGTTPQGGSARNGSVFRVNTDGSDFTNLHNFTQGVGGAGAEGSGTNSDGCYPVAGLCLSGNTLYGTAWQGGAWGNGTVFQLNTDGTCFKTLHSFSAISNNTNYDGINPEGELIISDYTLYGTTVLCGSGSYGTVFSISLSVPPPLTIAVSGSNVILTWPASATGFTLESTTNLATAVWSVTLPAPIVINGLCTVTNPIAGTQQFYKLSQ